MLSPSSGNLCSTRHSSGNLINLINSGGEGRLLFDHPFFSLDVAANSELALMVKRGDISIAHRIEDSINNNKNHSFTCYPNEIISNASRMSSAKSKVPDILMINKYYGLVPQKFTISSRKTANSTPSSAGSSSSRRCSKSNSGSKPRAKSSTYHNSHHNSNERKSAEDSKGFRSENDSPDPIKMILLARHGSPGGKESSDEKSSDPFGPVTKKMSVERYKKWKNGGGGKARNMNMRSSSDIGQTLSLLDNGLPGGGFPSHAKHNNRVSTASAEFSANRRVIKIDLNKVSSWDEENYRITTSSVDSSTRGENNGPKMKVVNLTAAASTPESDLLQRESRNMSMTSNNNNSSYSSSCDYSLSSTCYSSRSSSQEKNSPIYSNSRLDNNGSYTCFVNNDNDYDSLVTDVGHEEQTTFVSSIDTSGAETNESSSENMATVRDSSAFNSCGTSLEMSSSINRESITDGTTAQEELLAETRAVDENNENKGLADNKLLLNNDLTGRGENAIKAGHDQKVESMQRCGKLSSRTISFDDKILNGADNGGPNASRSDSSVKRRPTTASARFNSKTFTTPNCFNPPSKVIPWTQQKTAGGKALTLAERRAKFQRAPSIHSSSSLSMDVGEEEAFSEVESNNSHQSLRPPSSAFRESRKPLHVTQPPEIPTMIAQINPNADEDIQIEIEKVAIMLKKMHGMKHFSMSLDSGIEAEMAKASSAPEEPMISPLSKTVQSASTESGTIFPDQSNKNLRTSGSESSISSVESQSSEGEVHPHQKSGSKIGSASPLAKGGLCSNDNGPIPKKTRDKTPSSDSILKRQCSINNNYAVASNHSSSSIKKVDSATSSSRPLSCTGTSTAATSVTCTSISTGAARRPPLRKAVSISCEQELSKTGGDHKRNEVNFNANDNGKSPRPKTATVVHSQYQRNGNVSGTRSIHSNYQYRQSAVSCESHNTPVNTSAASNASQGSRNRKILIKKALMEINQSSVNMRKKWGTLGRPRTAPSSEKCNNAANTGGSHQHPRKPLKASPFPISANVRTGLSSSGKSASTRDGKTNREVMEGEKSNHTGHIQRSSSEAPGEESSSSPQQPENSGEKSSKGRFRQCFSLDEGALLGFSIKSVNGGRIPVFEKLASTESTESCPTSIMDDEISFLSSKKREQCLKVYEKMVKTGCTIKLETVFRGMLTPSEYRAFMRAAEKASQEEEEENENEEQQSQITGETLPNEVDTSSGK